MRQNDAQNELKTNYREIRKFKFFKDDNPEILVESMNKFLERKNAKVINYTLGKQNQYFTCFLLYSVTLKSN